MLVASSVWAQQNVVERPKMVIGIMVDQMRWDYLYRFYHKYGDGGFRRILKNGFTCENTLINYAPTVTACGHTCVYTGSVPAIHGIVGNEWYNRSTDKIVYCTDDSTAKLVGGNKEKISMSPRNMLATTVGDELRMSTNFKSKVVSIALKDRAAILPGGHSANAAFWYDDASGHFVTSTYYMPTLPQWATNFNNAKNVNKYLAKNWETLYPINTYVESTADDKPYEIPNKGENKPVFIHKLDNFIDKDFGMIKNSPYGNSLTFDFAKAAIEGFQLGATTTDMLAISFSSPDIIGHAFGPNSVEVQDVYLRLDKELAAFLTYLDGKYGKNNYLMFITADHGVAESPGYLKENALPGGALELSLANSLNEKLAKRFGIPKAILSDEGAQIYLDKVAIAAAKLNQVEIENFIIDELRTYNDIADAVSVQQQQLNSLPAPFAQMYINGRNAKRCGDIFIIQAPGVKNGSAMGATHGSMYPYDAHIPLLWFGWKVPTGKSNRTMGMTDIAPTVAAFLQIQMPSGNVGHPITEILPTK